MIYRPATVGDIDAAMDVVTEMTRGSVFGLPVREKIARLVDGRFFTCAAWDGDVIAGFIVGEVCETLINHEKHGHEKTLYVRPKYRGGTIAVRLVRAFEVWARERGATRTWLSQSTGLKTGKTAGYYMRQGYEIMGVNTCKELA